MLFRRGFWSMLLAAIGWGCLWQIPAVQAQGVSALSFPATNLGYSSGSTAVSGYSFNVNTTILVLDLSQYDLNADGLAGAGQVGLWTSDGALLAQATIPAGTTAAIQDSFRYVPLTLPLTLQPGQTYVVGGRASSADATATPSQAATTFAPQISYLAGRFGPNNSFTFPNVYSGAPGTGLDGYFGGSFLFTPVPEPDSATALLLGLGGGAAMLWRKRARRGFLT